MIILTYIVTALILGSLLWRALSVYINIPWPYFLAFWLENPYMKIFANPKDVIDEIDPKSGEKILEIGSGAGRILNRIASKCPVDITGVELQKKMIALATRKLASIDHQSKVNFINESITSQRLNLPSESFDKAVMVTVLGEIPNKDEALNKIRTLLKTGATLTIQEVIPDPCYIARKSLHRTLISAGFKHLKTRGSLLNYIATYYK